MNIKSLKDNRNVLDNFSTTLDGFLQSEPNITDIDSFENLLHNLLLKLVRQRFQNDKLIKKLSIMTFSPFYNGVENQKT